MATKAAVLYPAVLVLLLGASRTQQQGRFFRPGQVQEIPYSQLRLLIGGDANEGQDSPASFGRSLYEGQAPLERSLYEDQVPAASFQQLQGQRFSRPLPNQASQRSSSGETDQNEPSAPRLDIPEGNEAIAKCLEEFVDGFWAWHQPSNSCQPLLNLDNKVCDDGQWLVMDRETRQVVCKAPTCPNGQLRLTGTNLCLNALKPEHQGRPMCGRTQFLAQDQYGDGHCECRTDLGNVFWSDGNCYPVFTQGPCAPGELLVYDDLEGSSQCRDNPCPNGFVYWLTLGNCYEYTPGATQSEPSPCTPPYTFQLKTPEETGYQFRLECDMVKDVDNGFGSLFRKCGPGTIRDHNKECHRAVVLQVPTGDGSA